MNIRRSMNQVNTTASRLRVPERWLLIGPDQDWCNAAQNRLKQHVNEFPSPSFLAWRLKHGLIRVVTPKDLDSELKNALSRSEGTEVMPNATWIWAAMTADEWFKHSESCEALQWSWAKGLDVSLLSSDNSLEAEEDFAEFIESAEQPDTLASLTWLMSERPLPVPKDWLSLGPISELSEDQNTMAEEGYLCYSAWAQSVQDSYEPKELQELWGPFTEGGNDERNEHEGTQEGDDDKEVGKDMQTEEGSARRENVLQFERRPAEGPSQNDSWRRTREYAANSSTVSLAADGARGSGPRSPAPADTWNLEPSASHGAHSIQASVRFPTSEDDEPGIEFVALWNPGRDIPGESNDIRLVLTLSRRMPVLLTGRPDKPPAAGSCYSLRFDWPRKDWPDELRDTSTVVLKSELKKALKKARVSLM